MKLSNLAKYRHIVIQCHNIPDADTIGAGFALQCYLRSLGSDAILVYGGPAAIQKPSLIMLLELMNIEIAHITELPPLTELLITVDCQRGAGNVQNFPLPENSDFVVIDHHRPEITEGENTIIRPHLASCATLVWDLLNHEGFAMDNRIQNALFYGLYTDTNGLSELRHPLDRDLAELPSDAGLIRKLKNAAITLEELDVVGGALRGREIIRNIGLFRAEPCDANLLGFTGDIAQQVAHLDCCVVYCAQQHGLKLSVRSSTREIMANEITAFICRETGSGGGNIEKAGGFMSFRSIAETAGDMPPEDYLRSRVYAYLDNYNLIYADENDIDFGAMPLYKKLPRSVGFAKSTDIFPAGTKVTVRTLEGDVDTVSNANIYLMIGIQGEVYPIKKDRFEASYRILDKSYLTEAEYIPAIINRLTGERREVLPFAQTCVPKDSKLIRARKLTKDTKVFTDWDMEKYFVGSIGDYLTANEDNHSDCYIVRGDIFADSYEAV
jgi:phosphoglycolate phosphatase